MKWQAYYPYFFKMKTRLDRLTRLKKAILFDFDGTIADSEEVLFEVMNELSSVFGYRKIKKEEIKGLKKMTVSELMREFDVSFFKLPFILHQARKVFQQRAGRVSPFPAIPEVLEKICQQGHEAVIVTSNKKQTVEDFLQAHGIHCISKVFAVRSIFGKARALEKVVKQEGFNPEESFYVGDEIRDVEAAKKAGIKMIAVGWGFNSPDVLFQSKPDFLIEDPKEIFEIVAS